MQRHDVRIPFHTRYRQTRTMLETWKIFSRCSLEHRKFGGMMLSPLTRVKNSWRLRSGESLRRVASAPVSRISHYTCGISLMLLACTLSLAAQQPPSAQVKTAEQQFKNIQVLQG